MKKTLLFAVLFIAASIFSGCKTVRYVPVETVKTEYQDRIVYQCSLEKDSIYSSDSIFVKEKGDTVFIEKYNKLYIDRIRRDSIHIRDSIFIRDSIPVPFEVKVPGPVTNKLNWFQQTQIYAGWAALFALAVILLLRRIKK